MYNYTAGPIIFKDLIYLLTICICLLCLHPNFSTAAVSSGELRTLQRQQDHILQQQEERMRMQELELRQRGAPSQSANPKRFDHVPEVPDAACLEVSRINFTGITKLSSRERDRLALPYSNRCLTISDINNLLRAITNAYIDKGYVTTRAFVSPEQNGTELNIAIIEGKIEKIIINDGAKSYYWRGKTAFPGMEGELLNLREIEQGLDQLNRLPSGNATMDLEPGETVGGTVIKVSIPEAKSWQASLGFDNLGQRSTGEHQYSLSFIKDNFLGVGDQFSVFWAEDLFMTNHEPFSAREKYGSNSSFSFYFSIPYGYWTFSANLSRFKYKTTIFGNYGDYTTNGDTNLFGLQIDRVIHRDANGKTNFSLGLNRRKVDTYIAGYWLEASSYTLTTVQASLSHSRRLFGGLASGGLTYTRGIPWLDATKDPGGPSYARTEFDKYSLNLNWYRPFQIGQQKYYYSFNGFGQFSPQTLYGPERIQIGGYSSVRGFHEDSIVGDKGAYFRNELGWNLPWFEALQEGKTLYGTQLFAAYDSGFIHKDRKDSFERGEVQGIALGIRTLGDLHLSLTIAKALAAPDFVKKKDTELYASVSYTF